MKLQPPIALLAAIVSSSLTASSVKAEAPGPTAAPVAPPAPAADAGASGEKLEGAKLDALLGDIATARKKLRSLKANFTQERKMVLLAATVKSSGNMTQVGADRLRWELGAPDDVVYWVGPEGLSYRTKSSKATLPESSAKVARGLSDLRALLGGDLGALRERYRLDAVRSDGEVTIHGAAKDAAATIRGFTLVLAKDLVSPRRARLQEGKSDTVDIAFSGVVLDAAVDPALMRP